MFTRLDQEAHTTYELLRQGRMPESKGLIGQILNRMLGPEDKEALREQKLDADELRRRYLAAAVITSKMPLFVLLVRINRRVGDRDIFVA